MFFGFGRDVGKQASKQANVSVYKATLHKVLGISNSDKTLSCSFGGHTLKCKSLLFSIGDTMFEIPKYYAIKSNNFHNVSSPHFLSSLSVYFYNQLQSTD